jgi:hypothetical protein
MKTLKIILIFLLIAGAGLNIVNAQSSSKDKKTTKVAAIKKNVESKRYTFLANYVLPQRGGGRQLTSEYDLRVTPDSVISFLPYFGRAYFDVPYGGGDGGIKFTSTKFSYEVKEKKKGGWEITIIPSDVKNLNRLFLSISSDGYASLSVNSANRDFITFDGYLK